MKKVLLLFLLVGMATLFPLMNQARAGAFTMGDVFASSNGLIREFTPTGTLVQTLDTTHPGEGDGLAFDSSGNLYATAGFSANTVVKFNNTGTLVTANFGSGYNSHPESIVVDNANGVLYVGQPDGTHQVLKFDFNGNLLATYSPAIQDRGTDWVDLAADLHTIRYTSEGNTIFQYDLATSTQLANFNVVGLPNEPAYAHRILSDGGELVAATSVILRLDSAGNVVKTYTIAGTSLLFAINLDPDGTSFWTADYYAHNIFRLDIATGAILTTFNDGGSGVLGGLAVFGERTAPTVPLPPSVLLLGSGLIGLAGAGFGQRKFFKKI
jgi:WD40 repeat protein